MRTYLLTIIKAAEKTRELCSAAIEEINDGATRSEIILSLMEAVYAYKNVIKGYMKRYYNYFGADGPEFDKELNSRANRFLMYSPQAQLEKKISRRTSGPLEI